LDQSSYLILPTSYLRFLVQWFIGSVVTEWMGEREKWKSGDGDTVQWFSGSVVHWFISSLVDG
jgi:hypothetical protein